MIQTGNYPTEPEQDEILATILQKIAPPPMPTAQQQANSGSGDILTSLLSNPELIGKLPSILSSIKPILDILKPDQGASSPASTAASVTVTESAPEPPLSKDTPAALTRHSPSSDSRTALLCAMKPYLSRDRQNAIDYIVKIGKLGDILKTL